MVNPNKGEGGITCHPLTKMLSEHTQSKANVTKLFDISQIYIRNVLVPNLKFMIIGSVEVGLIKLLERYKKKSEKNVLVLCQK